MFLIVNHCAGGGCDLDYESSVSCGFKTIPVTLSANTHLKFLKLNTEHFLLFTLTGIPLLSAPC